MGDDRRQTMLRQNAEELLALENDLELAVDRQRQTVGRHPNVAAALAWIHEMIAAQREALEAYLERLGGRAIPGTSIAASLFETGSASPRVEHQQRVTGVLRADYAAFNYAAVSYAVLFEMALRLYEPPLRELAPKHMRGYAEAAQAINQLVAPVAAAELADEGLECHCICPMCGIGACGCVALGTATVNQAWRDTAPGGDPADGFPLQRPKPGSELAHAGVHAGDRLLELDGQPVQGIPEIQAAIRKHAIGDEIAVVVQRGAEPPREIRVRHVSDYPQT